MFWVATYIVLATLTSKLSGALAQEFPNVTLPWGTYQATLYDEEGDFWTFRNVRFGKAPTGKLRFQKSVFPDSVAEPSQLQPDEGASCYSVNIPASPKRNSSTSSDFTTAGPPRLLPGLPRSPEDEPSEDCLFADIYVPASALNGRGIPIVVWIYGGAFIFGAKDAGAGEGMPFYNATGLLRAAHRQNQDFIFITGNYRMGAFGWLAGPTMEQFGTPNAGLWDQRLLLDFAHQYLPQLGGDASNIGVWGESAGGGSILHHLTSSEPPVFTRALLQSPAYMWQWDRTETGYAAKIFQNLTNLANCSSTGAEALDCLQKLSDTTLQKLNEVMIYEEHNNTGVIPFNPAVDGSLIKQLPTNAFQQGTIWKNVTSFVVSHVFDEASGFVPYYINDDKTFDRFLRDFFPGPEYRTQRQLIKKQYGSIDDPVERASRVIGDSSFVCNTRFVFDAYNTISTVYMMQYDFFATDGAAVHASDLIPTFLNTDVSEECFYEFFHKLKPNMSRSDIVWFQNREKALALEYQPYLASFGALGVPEPSGWSPNWDVAQAGDELSDIMQVTWRWVHSDLTSGTTDTQNTKSICDFWYGIASSLEKSDGLEGLWSNHGQTVLKSDL